MVKGKKIRQKDQPRRVPERTCIACRNKRPKRALKRIVRTPTGEIIVDETGKANGRGAYICARRECWEQALKRGSLARALRATPTAETLEVLRAYAVKLPLETEATETTGASEVMKEAKDGTDSP